MKIGVAQPGLIVDVTRIPGLDRIEVLPDGAIRIGAMVRNADLARHKAILSAAPALAEAVLSGASGQLRNMARVGGNFAQATRCSYFLDPLSACNRRDPGAGCAAIGGETRGHAVLGWTDDCIAVHPSDMCVPLAAMDAVVEISGPDGDREDCVDSPALAHGDLITALRLPAGTAAFAPHARYLKLRERTSFAFAAASCAAMLVIEDGVIKDARLALGGVAARPWRSQAAEASLIGAAPGPDAFRRAGELALTGAKPSGDNGFKIELAIRIAARALARAAEGAPARIPALPGSVFAPLHEGSAHV